MLGRVRLQRADEISRGVRMPSGPNTILVPGVTTDGAEQAQGVFRVFEIDTGEMDFAAYGILAGYLASIWAKLHHPSFPDIKNIKILENQEGEFFYDFSQHNPNWTISRVEINVRSYPKGADLIFGTTEQLQAGVGAFFMSSESNYQLDWFPIEPLRTTMPMKQIGFIIEAPIGFPRPSPVLDNQFFGETRGINATNFRVPVPAVQPTLEFYGTVSFGGDTQPKTPKAPITLKSTVSNAVRAMYPIQWINFTHSVLVPQNVKANGFWWKLKPGVVADIALYGFEKQPGVELGSSEFGHFVFNPNALEDAG